MSGINFKSKNIWLAIFAIVLIYAALHPEKLSEIKHDPTSADFFFFSYIEENFQDFENSLTLSMADKVAPISWLMKISKLATNTGVPLTTQYVIFFCLQVLFVVTGIFLVVSGLNRSRQEAILSSILFLGSYFTSFGRYLSADFVGIKVVTSTLGLSFGFLAIGFFIRGQFVISAWISALALYIHPTHAFIMLGIFHTYILYNFLSKRFIPVRKMAYIYTGTGIIMSPWIVIVLRNSESIFSGAKIDAIWWSFLMAKTSNPFPLQDGVMIVLPSLIIFILVYWLLGLVNNVASDTSFSRARWVVASVFGAWLTQIIFTEVLPIPFVAQLALTRATPYAVLFMVIVYTITVWMHRGNDSTGAWLIFLLLPVFFIGTTIIPYPLRGFLGDEPVHPESAMLLFGLILYIKKQDLIPLSSRSQKIIALIWRIALFAMASIFILLCLLVAYKIKVRGFSVIAAILYNITIAPLLNERLNYFIGIGLILAWWIWQRWISGSKKQVWPSVFSKKSSIVITTIGFISVIGYFASVTMPGISSNPVNSSIQNMRQFVSHHTEKGAMILVVPLYDTREMSTIPLRPVFLDSAEAQYVLYNPATTKEVINRLKLIGMDLDLVVAETDCNGLKQYLKPMCRRKAFEQYASKYSDDWRMNLRKMGEVAPNLSYVLLKRKYLCMEDKPTYTSGDLALLHINDVHREGVRSLIK
jgi:hypothetical protein